MKKPATMDQATSSQPDKSRRRDEDGKFIAGVSGNPKGRPRKSREKLSLYDALLAPVPIRQPDGRIRKVPYPEAHIMKLQERSLKGDARASKELTQVMQRQGLFDKIAQVHNYAADNRVAQEEMIAHAKEALRRSKEATDES